MAEDRLAYSGIVYVGDTDQEGLEGARKIMWVITHNVAALQFKIPPGYAPARARLQVMRGKAGLLHGLDTSIEALVDQGIAFAGNPDTVYRQIERHYQARRRLRPPADAGAVGLSRARRDGEGDQALRARRLSAPQGVARRAGARGSDREIAPQDLVVPRQLGGTAGVADLALVEDMVAVAERQRRAQILLDQQDRQSLAP